MYNLNKNDELERSKVLLDIYRNENEEIKHEYRVLYDKYILLEKNNEELLQEIKKYDNSRYIKIRRKIGKIIKKI
mgnify:FL=1